MAAQTQPVRHARSGIAAANVRAEMARGRVTQAAVAEVLGIKQQSVSARLSGKVDFTAGELVALGDLFNLDPALLLRPSRSTR